MQPRHPDGEVISELGWGTEHEHRGRSGCSPQRIRTRYQEIETRLPVLRHPVHIVEINPHSSGRSTIDSPFFIKHARFVE